jgi:hypothetical protein
MYMHMCLPQLLDIRLLEWHLCSVWCCSMPCHAVWSALHRGLSEGIGCNYVTVGLQIACTLADMKIGDLCAGQTGRAVTAQQMLHGSQQFASYCPTSSSQVTPGCCP